MVKANAYGLGMESVVAALADTPGLDVWGFGVAAVAEGEQLRALGWTGRVLVFAPAPPDEFARAAEVGLTLCLSDLDGVKRWADLAASLGTRLPLHVEVDTGMGRAGFLWSEAAEWGPALVSAVGPLRWEGCYTHFHSADAADAAATLEQWSRFSVALGVLRGIAPPDLRVHAANSAASFREAPIAADLGRPGIFLYGGEAGPGTSPAPVAAVRARLALVREVPPGTTVGYGAEYRATRRERWGTLAIGYGDGIPRALWCGRGEVLIRGRRVPIIGRVSMDAITVDLSAVPEATAGDVATLIGRDGQEEITVDQVATRCGTISYEILTGLTPRLPRVYLEAGLHGS
jgi:alanine racemase